ncbi:DUF6094 domain-containing protein [Alicyclobacillus acidoterrestris]|uniref:DUF6094 domain-containing protein n=1 Tax=Alicyclobacillus acidoterrestris (strain ATCC 49025 / DSM 3922 / CIP 106132 / NCIMB 13137 / GD3B) TaxID=1356854 RepID=T0BUV4_ALIAG|nr:DUF6094 domain-containing protein [Alicyclobacillus acidoterrestris]EPZ47873.1 hypothetical protein N007_04755 [Alicyclobacillus acidoterrestris ATCC 49025]UNO51060.1 DUF6094 domain-containing protein [Alicyclobacillus acidoterrestris]GEO27906.1 hypothetical protein AAC03nite_36910 [Alicyclobacillus acidoterrestris]
MARYESDSRLGFYATPETMTEKIVKRLRFEGPARIFDPCCGKGIALQTVGKQAPVGTLTYGIELDRARATEATERLNFVVASPYEKARVDKASMSFLWLNPPYDNRGGQGGNESRIELSFLRDTAKYVAPGGVLVFIIPRTTLSKETVNALEHRYTNLAVYRFDDDEYQAYKQVVIFGVRREKPLQSTKMLTSKELEARRHLLAVGNDPTTQIPYLDNKDDRTWIIPTCDVSDDIEFRGDVRDEVELLRDLELSEGFKVAEHMLQGSVVDAKLQRPLLPYRRTHLATLIAAGALDGAVGIGEHRHMVIGTSRKVTHRDITYDEQGRETIVDTDEWVTIVRTIEPDGTIRDLQ